MSALPAAGKLTHPDSIAPPHFLLRKTSNLYRDEKTRPAILLSVDRIAAISTTPSSATAEHGAACARAIGGEGAKDVESTGRDVRSGSLQRTG